MRLRPPPPAGGAAFAAASLIVLALAASACGRGEARPDSSDSGSGADVGSHQAVDSVAAALEAEMAKFPERYAEEPFPLVSVEEVEALLAADADLLLVDAREPESYSRGHLPGAVNFPYGNWLEDGEPLAPTDRDLIVYCNSQDCPIARLWSQQAAQRGYTRVRHMKAGFAGWQEAGLAVETGEPRS